MQIIGFQVLGQGGKPIEGARRKTYVFSISSVLLNQGTALEFKGGSLKPHWLAPKK